MNIHSRVRALLICSLTVVLIAGAQPGWTQQPSLGDLASSLEDLTRTVSPAVVHVIVTGYDAELGGVTSGGLLPKTESGGSGVIVDPSGYIITNNHVVENATRIRVTLTDVADDTSEFHSILKPKDRPVDATLIGSDLETDLAVLKIAARNLPYLQFGDSDDLRQGQLVMAFGSPFGLDNSVTLGVVSSIARQLVRDDPMIYIQTDATINPGNSGGALVNMRGELVGINTLILSQSGGSEGIGFAAPSNIVEHVYRQIREFRRVRRGAIGIHAQTITPLVAEGLSLPQKYGVIVGDVYPDYAAEESGLRIGDIILTLNGKRMENGRQFDVNMYRQTIGERVVLEIIRDGQQDTIEVEVIERPNDPGRFADLVSPQENLIPELAILGLELSPEIRGLLPQLRRTSGVLVASRQLGGGPLRDGLLPGDVIYEINGYPVGGLAALRSFLSRQNSGDPIVALIERRGRLMFLAFELI